MTVAALGGQVEIPTLDGRVSMTIPAGTQNGTTLRLAGKGVKSLRTYSKGDLFCTIEVEIPTKLTEEQKDLLRQFAKTFNSGKQEVQESSSSASKSKKSSSKGEGVMDSLKSFFEDLKK